MGEYAGEIGMHYKVGTAAGVKERMQALADLASLAGLRQSYLDALTTMRQRLGNDPLAWGDPLYNKPPVGGIVCRAVVDPIIVHYSVHESSNSVIILRIDPLLEWPIRP
jgi:hypothetical protein